MYGIKVHFSIADDIHREDLYYHRKYKLPYERDNDFEGKTLNFGVAFCIIVDKKYLTFNTIGHEMYHLTTQICGEIGVMEEEQRSWVQGHLLQEIVNFCKRQFYEIH